jgi:hypothetical protein
MAPDFAHRPLSPAPIIKSRLIMGIGPFVLPIATRRWVINAISIWSTVDGHHRCRINGTVVRPSVGVRAIERPWIVAVWAIMPDSDTYSKAYSKTETYSKTAAKTDRKMPTTCFRVQSCGKKHKDQAGRDGKPLSFHMNTSEINPIHPDAENEQSVHSQSPSLWACHESYWHIFATMNSGRLAGWIGF